MLLDDDDGLSAARGRAVTRGRRLGGDGEARGVPVERCARRGTSGAGGARRTRAGGAAPGRWASSPPATQPARPARRRRRCAFVCLRLCVLTTPRGGGGKSEQRRAPSGSHATPGLWPRRAGSRALLQNAFHRWPPERRQPPTLRCAGSQGPAAGPRRARRIAGGPSQSAGRPRRRPGRTPAAEEAACRHASRRRCKGCGAPWRPRTDAPATPPGSGSPRATAAMVAAARGSGRRSATSTRATPSGGSRGRGGYGGRPRRAARVGRGGAGACASRNRHEGGCGYQEAEAKSVLKRAAAEADAPAERLAVLEAKAKAVEPARPRAPRARSRRPESMTTTTTSLHHPTSCDGREWTSNSTAPRSTRGRVPEPPSAPPSCPRRRRRRK